MSNNSKSSNCTIRNKFSSPSKTTRHSVTYYISTSTKSELTGSTNISSLLQSKPIQTYQPKKKGWANPKVVGPYYQNVIRKSGINLDPSSSKRKIALRTKEYLQKHVNDCSIKKFQKSNEQLCKNCGVVASFLESVCQSCKKSASKEDLQARKQLSDSTTNCKHQKTTSSYFYGKNGLSDFSNYLSLSKRRSLQARRQQTNPERNLAECITISDSSDDEGSIDIVSVKSLSDSSLPSPTPVSDGTLNLPSIEIPTKLIRVDSLVPDDSTSVETVNSFIAKSYGTVYVPVNGIRIGQLKKEPSSFLQITKLDWSITFTDGIFRIKWFGISLLELSPVNDCPCFFLTIHDDYLPSIRSTYHMVPGKTPYLNPHGPVDQQYIIVFIDKIWFSKNEIHLRRRFNNICEELKRPKSFFQEITLSELSRRLEETADVFPQVVSETPTTSALSQSPSRHNPVCTCGTATRQSMRSINRSNNDVMEVQPPFNGPRIELAIYPPPPATGGITITNADLYCLNEGELLNDVIIDFYLKYIMETVVSPADKERSHVFSSFFFPRLTQIPKINRNPEDKELNLSQRRHTRVRKWTRNVDIFSKDFIFVPINDSSHWYLAVICFPGRTLENIYPSTCGPVVTNVRSLSGAKKSSQTTASDRSIEDFPLVIENQSQLHDTNVTNNDLTNDIEMYDLDENDYSTSDAANSTENSLYKRSTQLTPKEVPPDPCPLTSNFFARPCILIFDSLKTVSRSKAASALRDYLNEEWKSRKSDQDLRIFDRFNMRMSSPYVPQQNNYTDCGLFLLHYVEKMFQKPIQDFTLPIKSLIEWFNSDEVSMKRQNIKDIIELLRRTQSPPT